MNADVHDYQFQVDSRKLKTTTTAANPLTEEKKSDFNAMETCWICHLNNNLSWELSQVAVNLHTPSSQKSSRTRT